MSPAAWSHWEQFLSRDLDQFRTVPESNSGWPLLVLQRASQRVPRSCDDDRCTVSSTNAEYEGRILEEMLDEERVPVQVRKILLCLKLFGGLQLLCMIPQLYDCTVETRGIHLQCTMPFLYTRDSNSVDNNILANASVI